MQYELVVVWMDALIELWYKVRLIRTLSWGGGDEYATWIAFPSDREFQLSIYDRKEIAKIADILNTELTIDNTDDEYEYWSFMYKGFKFFTLVRKED